MVFLLRRRAWREGLSMRVLSTTLRSLLHCVKFHEGACGGELSSFVGGKRKLLVPWRRILFLAESRALAILHARAVSIWLFPMIEPH